MKIPTTNLPIRLIVFDLDDTLIYSEKDETIPEGLKRFTPIEDKDGLKIVDSPDSVQKLVPFAREIIAHLNSLGIILTWSSMGPEWQMRRFIRPFGLEHYFDWELGSYDRRDKGEKVELCINHLNSRLQAEFGWSNDFDKIRIKNEEVLFVDDNLGYLARVDSYLPGIKVLWAHYRGEFGMKAFYYDLKEELNIILPNTPDLSMFKEFEETDE